MLINLVGYFFVYSLLGWVLETIWRSVEDRRFVPSGAFGFPLCEIYGIGALGILGVLFLWPELAQAFWVFQWLFFSALLGFYEYLSGIFCLGVFGRRFWDYTNLRWDFGGHTSLFHMAVWGVLAVLFIHFIHPSVRFLVEGA